MCMLQEDVLDVGTRMTRLVGILDQSDDCWGRQMGEQRVRDRDDGSGSEYVTGPEPS